MKLPNILIRDRGIILSEANGFTLIEILVAFGIFVLILSLGLLLAMDFYKTYAFNYETSLLAASLQSARSRALSNMNQSPHGLHFENGVYVIFEGGSYDSSDPKNKTIPMSYLVEVKDEATGLPAGDIIFEQLSGSVSGDFALLVQSGAKSSQISVNREGGINW